MRAYSNMATHRLEKAALKVGVQCTIRVMEAQEDGRYFVTEVDGEPLKQPIPLGFTDEQAVYSLKMRRWERFILPGAPVTLMPAKKKSKSYAAW